MNVAKVGAKTDYAVCPCKSGKFITITSYHVGWAGRVKSKTARFFASPAIKKRQQKRISRALLKLVASIDDISEQQSQNRKSRVVDLQKERRLQAEKNSYFQDAVCMRTPKHA